MSDIVVPKTDLWWASLRVSEKERIATKITGLEVHYPDCTDVWEKLPETRKKAIMEHVSDKHGHLLKEWWEGFPLTD